MATRCAVVGATGLAGQQFLAALMNHPFFEVARIAASPRSANKKLIDAVQLEGGGTGWYVEPDALAKYRDMVCADSKTMSLDGIEVVFTAIDSEPARELEPMYAERVPVISTASAFRYEADVPILIPAVNGAHSELIRVQQKRRGWDGFIVTGPNCTTTGMAIALAPLHNAFGIEKVIMTSLQSTSGAGRSPGVIALDIVDNVIPYIKSEEEKVAKETQKILGTFAGEAVQPLGVRVSCTCTRVPVLEGHTEAVTVALSRHAGVAEAISAMKSFGRDMNPNTHPSAPQHWITVSEDPFRPQPRRDRDNEGGMTTTVGRVRPDDVLGDHGLKLVLVSHNTKMGAAKGAILIAEDLKLRGFI